MLVRAMDPEGRWSFHPARIGLWDLEINATTLREAAEDAMDAMGLAYKTEGETSSKWSLIDAGDVVVHIFSRNGRDFYKLERLWDDAPSIRFESED